MKIAYLVNQYPKVSHSFIRREIQQLEILNLSIKRYSIRRSEDELKDDADKEELHETRFILDVGILGLFLNTLKIAIVNFPHFLKALILTLKIGYSSDKGILVNLAYLAEACVLSFWLKQDKIRHIHAHFGTNSTTVAMLVSVLGDFTYSFTVHGPEEFDKVEAIALPEKLKRATFVVAISDYGKSQLYRWCDYRDWGKIHVIHCGLEEKFIKGEILPIPSENKLVCVGRLCPQKAQLLLLKAIANLKERNIYCHLTLVGDGDLREEIENLATQLDITSQVKITGWASSDQVIQYIRESKIMVLPSFAEGLPVVLMESLALGRPVISTYVAGIPELVINDEWGWLSIAGDVDTLTDVIGKAVNLPVETLAEMGKKGKEKVSNNHNISLEAKKLSHLFNYFCSSNS